MFHRTPQALSVLLLALPCLAGACGGDDPPTGGGDDPPNDSMASVFAPTAPGPGGPMSIPGPGQVPNDPQPVTDGPADAPVPGGDGPPAMPAPGTGDAGGPSAGDGDGPNNPSAAPDAGTDVGGEPAGDNDLCEVGVYDGQPPRVLSLSGNTFAHDPTMIEADGVYYRFWTGDDIPMATSTNLMDWRSGPSVYRGGYPSWVRDWLAGVPGQTFNFPWAPDVSFFSGRHHIYSSFSARFGDNISCMTHLSTDDIAGGDWTDHGPVLCTEGNERYNAIDAEVALDTDGTPWLAFGSFWDGIMLAELDADGNRVGDDLTRLAWAREIEAPVLLRRCGYYYLFVTWGLCCPGEGRSVDQLSYRVAVGRSRDIQGPYVDRDGTPMLEGGGTLMVEGDGTFAAAGHSDVLVSGDKIYHLYHAYRRPRGSAELRIVEMPFDDEGWPVPAGP